MRFGGARDAYVTCFRRPWPLRTAGARVDAAGVDQVGGHGEVEAASCPAGLFDHAHAARGVGLALLVRP
jgi:hypothetical protein